jgi:L-lysine exporter family protein LysE/ArgO
MLQHLLKGILIGLGAAMPLGPVNVEIARRTLRGGYFAGFFLGAGACSIDVMYAILTTLSVGRFLNINAVSWPLAIGSILLLTYLGVMCLKSALQVREVAADVSATVLPGRVSLVKGYGQGLLMTLVNPMTIAFWFVGLPGVAGKLEQSALPWICAGVFLGTISWVIAFSGTLAFLGRFNRGVWMQAADAFGGLTLIGFAVAVFLRSILPHL